MKLYELREARPDLFCPQDWFEGEDFMLAEPGTLGRCGALPVATFAEPYEVAASAADLAALYVLDPSARIWRGYLWTSDLDRWGRRVYVGGIGQAGKGGFQIHRHLEINQLWGWPVWR